LNLKERKRATLPSGNFDKEQTVSSMTRMADLMAKENAQLWIKSRQAAA
jgi:hypothetical protein